MFASYPGKAVLSVTVLFTALTTLSAIRAAGQEKKDSPADERHQKFREEAARYALARHDDRRLKLHPVPLMNWANPERTNNLGSIFVWELQGRPMALGTVFRYEIRNVERWKLALHSLADGPLTARSEGGEVIWSPQIPGIARQAFPETPAPADSPALRLVQMRALARQFQVTLTDREGRETPLRLLPQPVRRYASPESGIQDGAIFGWMVATDPEAFLLVELSDAGQWRYAFARFHFWKLRAELEGKAVWDAAEELDQAHNTMGAADFQSRVYSSMVIAPPP